MAVSRALDLAAGLIRRVKVVAYTDCKKAMRMIASPNYRSRMVGQCKKKLNELGELGEISLCYVRAHGFSSLHDEADRAAKTAAGKATVDESAPVAWQSLRATVREHTYDVWQERWEKLKSCKQTKCMVPLVASEAAEIIRESRSAVGLLIPFLTGHNALNRHGKNIGRVEDGSCRLCGHSVEDAAHLLWDCRELEQPRGALNIERDKIPGIRLVVLLSLIHI